MSEEQKTEVLNIETDATQKQYNLIEEILEELRDLNAGDPQIPGSFTHETMTKQDASDYIKWLKEMKHNHKEKVLQIQKRQGMTTYSAVRQGLAIKLAQKELLHNHKPPQKHKKLFLTTTKFYYNMQEVIEAELRAHGSEIK